MEPGNLLALLAAHVPLEELAARLRDGDTARLLAGPVPSAARPALGAFLTRAARGPAIFVTSTLEAAARLREDLLVFLGDDVAVHLFPAADALWYEHMSVGDDVIGARLRALQALHAASLGTEAPATGPIIVAPVKALMQPALTPADLSEASRVLTVGQSIDVQALVHHFSEIGYRHVAVVEATGEWSSRGGIIDIWPPTDERPLRIDLFGDEIDSLRRFEPLSQRSEHRERQVTILPPHEIPFWRHTAAVEALCGLDLETLRPEVQREWHTMIERLENGERFEGRAFFAPLFAPETGQRSLLEHLPPGSLLLLSEARQVRDAAQELERQAEEIRASQIATGELPRRFPRPYLSWDELTGQASRLRIVDLSSQPIEDHDTADRANGKPAEASGLLSGLSLQPCPLSPSLFGAAERYGGQMKRVLDAIETRLKAGERVVVVSPQSRRIAELCEERGLQASLETSLAEDGAELPPLTVLHSSLSEGWTSADLRLTVLSDSEIFGFQPRQPIVTKRKRQQREIDRQAFLQTLKPGDYVVHIEHGIAV